MAIAKMVLHTSRYAPRKKRVTRTSSTIIHVPTEFERGTPFHVVCGTAITKMWPVCSARTFLGPSPDVQRSANVSKKSKHKPNYNTPRRPDLRIFPSTSIVDREPHRTGVGQRGQSKGIRDVGNTSRPLEHREQLQVAEPSKRQRSRDRPNT